MLIEQTNQPGQDSAQQSKAKARHDGKDDKPSVDPETKERGKGDNGSKGGTCDHPNRNEQEKAISGLRHYAKAVPWVVTTLIALACAWTGYAGIRPYVSFEGQVSDAGVSLTFTNRGSTPANELWIDVEVFADRYPPGLQLTGAKMIDQNIPTTLAAGEQCQYVDHDIDTSVLKTTNMAIYAVGVVVYKDVFGVSHQERISLIQGGPYPVDAESMGVFH